MENYYGSYALLASLPIWQIVIIFYLLTLFVIDAGREKLEGFSFNVSHAARYGDVGLLIFVLIGATLLHELAPIQIINSWWGTSDFQIFCGVASIAIGIGNEVFVLWQHKWKFGQLVDEYHNIFIVPLFLYCLSTLAPIIWIYGGNMEIGATLFFLLLWLVLMIYDIKAGRLDQRPWLINHGYGCILKEQKGWHYMFPKKK